MSESAKSAAERERLADEKYRKWVEKMPLKQRAKLAQMDKRLLRPMRSGSSDSGAVRGGEAGAFSDDIGVNIGEVTIEFDGDREASPEQIRFDELMALAPVDISADAARRYVRKIIQADAHKDRAAVGENMTVVAHEFALTESRAREMLIEARDAKLSRLQLRVLLMAAGWADEAVESMRGVGKDYGLSPTQVSNLVRAAQAKYGFAPNQFNKSAEDTATYRETNGK